jgi:sigma-B regulation protein RsbU (phosphoserine phosphatase)
MCAVNSPLLGVDARGEMGAFEQAEDHLAPGDTMFVYTDGVPDSQGPGGGFLETAGVAGLVRPLADAAPDAVCRSVTEHLDHLGGGRRSDDVTVLALNRTRIA